MDVFENTFVRGPSPSYSDEANSDSALSITLPLEALDMELELMEQERMEMDSNDFDYFDEKSDALYDDDSCSHLYPSPVRQGRNSFAFWMVVVTLLLLTVGNMIITIAIMGVLRLGKGIQGMELIPEVDLIKLYGETDLDRVQGNPIGLHGFANVPVTVSSDGLEGGIHFRVFRNSASIAEERDFIVINGEGITMEANLFEMKDPADAATVSFSTHRPQYNIVDSILEPTGIDMLDTKVVSTTRITSPIDEPLIVESDDHMSIKGSEGVKFNAANITLQVEHHATLNSTQGAIVLEGTAGIFVDVERLPLVSSDEGLRTGSVQYKICVCMPAGRLYRIAVPRVHSGPKISCAHFNSQFDPCDVN
ncbi:Scgbeta [Drosophila busckii]|uniref:Beta-sarcoglycan n=1 Tax=Drosophila busckii TaxID=30019 RepID=A0A0M5J717_DROBS|nr:Scgbeta [Drosophila busckii]